MKNKKNKNAFGSVRLLTVSAMLTAISVVIGFICKIVPFLNLGIGLRITFENLPIIMSGLLFGPVVGACVGLAADLLSCLVSGQGPILLVSVGAMTVGLISGIVARSIVTKKGTAQIAISVSVSHLIGSVIIKTVGLWLRYGEAAGMLLLFRIPIYICIAAIEIVLLCILLRHEGIRRLTNYS